MCGITGFLEAGTSSRSDKRALLQAMTDRLGHRGPDAAGYWQSADGVANLGHRRLSIIDLTPTGAQPMVSADARYILTYNGEIYNFNDLRTELVAAGVVFRGTSDTEVLVEAVARWGLEATLPRLNGMFAFALWDERDQVLSLARDRFGEKPLYYCRHGGVFIFGSELKPLRRHPSFRAEIDADALVLLMRFNYVPAPLSIYKEVRKLEAGHLLQVSLTGGIAAPRPYWTLFSTVAEREPLSMDPTDPALVDMLEDTLGRAVRMRMVADVPLGAFLSGGIDSSVAVALMQKHSSRPVKTFTIGFWETNYNEAKDAAAVARHLGTEHHELYLGSQECLDIIARLPQIYDEPFADSSQIPTTLVSEFTRRHVTVALSGDGGDELFGGYNRYFWSARMWPTLNWFSGGFRHRTGSLLQQISPNEWDKMFRFTDRMLPRSMKVRGAGEKLHKLALAMGARTPDDLYRCLVSQWQQPAEVVPRGREPDMSSLSCAVPLSLDFVERMMYRDTITYLPDDILCKVDRASMSVSLEARVPYLDNDVVQLAWQMPLATKVHKGVGKWPLRQLLKRHVPAALFDRPKAGFGIPIGAWLRGPLRDWAEDLLAEKRLHDLGFFNAPLVRRKWAEHLSGRLNNQHALWGVLMFQAWLTQSSRDIK